MPVVYENHPWGEFVIVGCDVRKSYPGIHPYQNVPICVSPVFFKSIWYVYVLLFVGPVTDNNLIVALVEISANAGAANAATTPNASKMLRIDNSSHVVPSIQRAHLPPPYSRAAP